MNSPFSIFKKTNNSFQGETAEEETILVLRKHPFFIILKTIFTILIAIISILILYMVAPAINRVGFIDIAFFGLSVWILILWLGIFYQITMYMLDVWIITNKRVIDSTQNGFFNRTVSELHISRIQDVSTRISSPIATFLNFGDISIQTAAEEEKFKFVSVPNPEQAKGVLMDLITKTRNHI